MKLEKEIRENLKQKFYEPKIIKLKEKQYLDISGIDTTKLKNDD